MNFIEKIQNLSLEKRKAILWLIVAIIGIFLFVWRVNVFRYRISQNSSFVGSQYQQEFDEMKRNLDEMRGIINETKEVGSLLKDTTINLYQDIILVQEYINENSENPEEDLARIENDEDFFLFILNKAKQEKGN